MRAWLLGSGRWFAVWFVAVLLPSQLAAQDAVGAGGTLKVAVLRATQGDAGAAADAIDGALLRDLAAIAGIENPTVSPIDYVEIQLTVGCSDEGRECLASIAQTVQVDAIVVRKLAVEADAMTLTLVYLDATAQDAPAHAEQIEKGEQAAQRLTSAVPSLVRRLFGVPEPVVASAATAQPGAPASAAPQPSTSPAPAHAAGGGGRVGALTWMTLAAGAGVLGAGIVIGLGAQGTFDEFKAIEIEDEDDARRAQDEFDSAESQGVLATVLIPVGAAVLALGATLLVLDLSDDGESATEIAVQPLHGGALLSLRGTTGGL